VGQKFVPYLRRRKAQGHNVQDNQVNTHTMRGKSESRPSVVSPEERGPYSWLLLLLLEIPDCRIQHADSLGLIEETNTGTT